MSGWPKAQNLLSREGANEQGLHDIGMLEARYSKKTPRLRTDQLHSWILRPRQEGKHKDSSLTDASAPSKLVLEIFHMTPHAGAENTRGPFLDFL